MWWLCTHSPSKNGKYQSGYYLQELKTILSLKSLVHKSEDFDFTPELAFWWDAFGSLSFSLTGGSSL